VLSMCNSPELGKVVASVCESGCIACRLCERACPVDAIRIKNNLPVIDQGLCDGCGKCVEACPRGVLELLSPRGQASDLEKRA
jgi:electron transport complex protein RnfB